jgi:hypothetical protein
MLKLLDPRGQTPFPGPRGLTTSDEQKRNQVYPYWEENPGHPSRS